MNNIKNVEVQETALSDSIGTTNFYIYDAHLGNITGDLYSFRGEPITVPKTTMDDLVNKKEIVPPILLKLS